jgi:hypothetical protein
MPFQKGQSGNPAGRPRGIVNRATALAQNLLSERVEGIARKVIELAEEGDMAAIRVCMERLVPPIKHQPVALELPPIEKAADSVEAMASIAAAVAAGDLTAAEAAELAKVVDVYVRALDSKGFDERLSALEKEINGTRGVAAPAAVRDDTGVWGLHPCRTHARQPLVGARRCFRLIGTMDRATTARSGQRRIWLRNSLVRSCWGWLKKAAGSFTSTIWPASSSTMRFAT